MVYTHYLNLPGLNDHDRQLVAEATLSYWDDIHPEQAQTADGRRALKEIQNFKYRQEDCLLSGDNYYC